MAKDILQKPFSSCTDDCGYSLPHSFIYMASKIKRLTDPADTVGAYASAHPFTDANTKDTAKATDYNMFITLQVKCRALIEHTHEPWLFVRLMNCGVLIKN